MNGPELHEITVRRRGDPDVKALLLEIKRPHSGLVEAYATIGPIHKALPDLTSRETVLRRHTDLLEAEPAVDGPSDSHIGKPQRDGSTDNERERAAKRWAREKRG